MRRDFYPLMMADDSNILDAETINWRMVAYPIVVAVVVLFCGFGYYYYQQSVKEQLASQAGEAIAQAKTPEQLVKVADQFPTTDQATLALLSAAGQSFDKKDYAAATKSYQRALSITDENSYLHDSAQVGLAATFDALGNTEEALHAYMAVAHRGNNSPYAPFACQALASIYEQRGDKSNERQILSELAGLGSDSPFVKDAAAKLKEFTSANDAPLSSPQTNPGAPAPTPTVNAAPAPKQ